MTIGSGDVLSISSPLNGVWTGIDELPCRNQGMSVFQAQEGEMRAYFSDEFVSKLKEIASEDTGQN